MATKHQTPKNKPCPLRNWVQETVERLSPLYNTEEKDTPDNVLRSYPNSNKVAQAHRMFIDAMLPGRTFAEHPEPFEIKSFLTLRISEAMTLLIPELEKAIPFRWISQNAQSNGGKPSQDIAEECKEIMHHFFLELPRIRSLIIEDIKAGYDGDPAAMSYAEVQLAYPGLLAISSHRIAHILYKLDVPIIPRIMSEWVHAKTGVDIHPGARIGHGLFIDHATGVVIGETCRIGDRVKIYQGVTLGAKSAALEKGEEGKNKAQRHPTVENEAIIYANATILGGDTVIGHHSTIGGNLFLIKSVPPYSFVIPELPGVKVRTHKNLTTPQNYDI